MKNLSSKRVLSKLNDVTGILPQVDVLNFFSKLTDAYQEHQVTQRDIAEIEAQKDVLLTQIERKYDAFYFVFNKIFEERSETIHKMFDIIDQGIKQNDRDLISLGLQNLSRVVSSSPFANMQQLSGMLENNKIIEI